MSQPSPSGRVNTKRFGARAMAVVKFSMRIALPLRAAIMSQRIEREGADLTTPGRAANPNRVLWICRAGKRARPGP